MQSLLNKLKDRLLKYILIHRKGDIFNKLLNKIEHHSLSQLLIELMQIKESWTRKYKARERANSE